MKPTLRTLIVEDSADDARLMTRALERSGFAVEAERVETVRAMQTMLTERAWDVVLADYALPHFSGIEALLVLRQTELDLPLIIVSGVMGEEAAVEAMKAGANDYVMKDRLTRLAPVVERELAAAEERRRLRAAERQARREQDRLRALVEKSAEGIVVADPAGGILYSSPSTVRTLGYRPGEITGRSIFDLVAPEDRDRLRADFAALRQCPGAMIIREARAMHRDGSFRWLELTAANLQHEPAVEGMVVNYHDITERKETEARLRQQAALLDRANDAIYVTDLDGAIRYWNPAAQQIFGWTAAEVLNRRATALFTATSPTAAELTATLARTGDWAGERRLTTRSGAAVDVWCRLTLLRGGGKEADCILAINTDITEKKRLEEQLLRTQRLESVGALAGGIAHDLNNVLAPILIGAPLLRRSLQDPMAIRVVRAMETSAQRGADIVKQVLTFARGVESQRVALQPRHVLREMEKIAGETFPKNIQIEMDAADDLALVQGDATQLHQALMNLCVNARDAMPEGGRLVLEARNVTLEPAAAAAIPGGVAGAFVLLSVADTGTGISAEIAGRIFEPFFTTKEAGSGSGLGLPTVVSIVRSHGGFVRVDTVPGQGSTFELYLPAIPATENVAMAASAPPWPHGAGERLLLIDDEAAVREVARQALVEFGYRVITCSGGAEALEVYRRRRGEIRLVLTDMMMPQMDGAALVRALRKIDPQVAIIGLTGVTDEAEHRKMEDLGLIALLRKPVTVAQLLNAVHDVVGTGLAAAIPERC